MRLKSNMSFALVVGMSRSRSAAAFAAQRSSTQLKGSFFDDLAANFQRSFSSVSDSKYCTVGITGASGLLGSALIDELTRQQTVNGKPVRIVKLTRQDAAESKALDDSTIATLGWNPKATSSEDVVSPEALEDIDVLVHLAGENVATGLGPLGFLGIRPWSDEKKQSIIDSRVGPTEGLAKAVAACKTPTTFLVASGVGVYGDNFIGESAPIVDEKADVSGTAGFLADVSREWEAASQAAGNNRVVNCRLGVVLSKNGGALAKQYPIFFLGGGGVVGSGQQYLSFISARDVARAFVHTMNTPELEGPVNFCSPSPCTNAEFTQALGKVLGRPTILPLPGFVVSMMFGEMGKEMLLGGIRVSPGKLENSGFSFEHAGIEEALQSAMDESI